MLSIDVFKSFFYSLVVVATSLIPEKGSSSPFPESSSSLKRRSFLYSKTERRARRAPQLVQGSLGGRRRIIFHTSTHISCWKKVKVLFPSVLSDCDNLSPLLPFFLEDWVICSAAQEEERKKARIGMSSFTTNTYNPLAYIFLFAHEVHFLSLASLSNLSLPIVDFILGRLAKNCGFITVVVLQ